MSSLKFIKNSIFFIIGKIYMLSYFQEIDTKKNVYEFLNFNYFISKQELIELTHSHFQKY